jgi:D-alanyl-D-alanine carboxypeptidase
MTDWSTVATVAGWQPLPVHVAAGLADRLGAMVPDGGEEITPVVDVAVVARRVRAAGLLGSRLVPPPAGNPAASESGSLSRFPFYSVTKLAIAAAALRAMGDPERLGLRLDEVPVAAGTPHWPGATVADLLRHTAGVPDYGDWSAYHEAVRIEPGDPWPTGEYLARAAALGPVCLPPGTFHYSNIGYLLAGRLVEAWTRRRLDAAIADLLPATTGGPRAGLSCVPGDRGPLTPSVSPLYPGRDASAVYHPGWVSHGTIVGDVPTMADLLAGLVEGDLLPGWARDAVFTASVPVARDTPYGRLGWGCGALVGCTVGDGDIVGHTGGGPGWSTAALSFRDAPGEWRHVAVAVNREGDQLAGRIAVAVNHLYRDPLPARPGPG